MRASATHRNLSRKARKFRNTAKHCVNNYKKLRGNRDSMIINERVSCLVGRSGHLLAHKSGQNFRFAFLLMIKRRRTCKDTNNDNVINNNYGRVYLQLISLITDDPTI